ncbi:MAG: hypothetical protein SFU56_20120 [Capsulimonadales bacterium]|nr:hypothetical protein [Capsulimonadales bacterium]
MAKAWFPTLLLILALLSAGCGQEKLDTSKGSFGKTDNTTTLPAQPNPQDVAKSRGANPNQGGPAGNAPATAPGQ